MKQQTDPKIAPETDALIDKLVADLVARYLATGDGLAVLSGEQKAWKVLRKQCPAGRRVAAHTALQDRLSAALSPILLEIFAEDIAPDRRKLELEKREGNYDERVSA